MHCSAVPPREAGYALGQSFLASPAAGLGDLEAAALPVYGDLVALSEGETRQWAIAACSVPRSGPCSGVRIRRPARPGQGVDAARGPQLRRRRQLPPPLEPPEQASAYFG